MFSFPQTAEFHPRPFQLIPRSRQLGTDTPNLDAGYVSFSFLCGVTLMMPKTNSGLFAFYPHISPRTWAQIVVQFRALDSHWEWDNCRSSAFTYKSFPSMQRKLKWKWVMKGHITTTPSQSAALRCCRLPPDRISEDQLGWFTSWA
jgi:hypothetical protein